MFQRLAITARAQASRAAFAPAARQLHASPIAAKTATEKVSEVADKVNKSLGQGLASAIETGEKATEKTKQTLGTTKEQAADAADSAKAKTQETSQTAKEKASETASVASKKKNEFQAEQHK
ncbi:hypothetical protein BV25DRAFT_1818905 [Artomyces pyxidatus]|uniref:Uncharacterized protein n=1 Tax=Artomyces pyxidatus TaxID=48021 RepID=A0ACB8TGI8_9AGAM|nr:hypothetical protein BV25DRAFT_1818905 [Artomyces pyxidatus]